MNQFHTPSFGDEVFELNDSATTTPADPQFQSGSRRMLSLDHSTLDEEEDHIDYEAATQHLDTYGGVISNSSMTQQQQQQQQLLPQPSQSPTKPLAPFALFFRDTVTAIKQQNPACSLEEISAIVNTMWDALDETQKSVYQQKHELDKRDYGRQLRDYRQQLSDSPEGPLNTVQSSEQSLSVDQLSLGGVAEAAAQPKVAEAEAEAATVELPLQQNPLLNEAAAVQKCTRDQCNKPAIINPDWEDEYCSNECVVVHCRNVFSEWVHSLKNSPS